MSTNNFHGLTFSGWLAHWVEMLNDPDIKIARPRQVRVIRRYSIHHDRSTLAMVSEIMFPWKKDQMLHLIHLLCTREDSISAAMRESLKYNQFCQTRCQPKQLSRF